MFGHVGVRVMVARERFMEKVVGERKKKDRKEILEIHGCTKQKWVVLNNCMVRNKQI